MLNRDLRLPTGADSCSQRAVDAEAARDRGCRGARCSHFAYMWSIPCVAAAVVPAVTSAAESERRLSCASDLALLGYALNDCLRKMVGQDLGRNLGDHWGAADALEALQPCDALEVVKIQTYSRRLLRIPCSCR